MDADIQAAYDQMQAQARRAITEARSFVLIVSDTVTPEDTTDDVDDLGVEIILGCNGHFVMAGVDILTRQMFARALFPEAFDRRGDLK